jgi:hypothetical protein
VQDKGLIRLRGRISGASNTAAVDVSHTHTDGEDANIFLGGEQVIRPMDVDGTTLLVFTAPDVSMIRSQTTKSETLFILRDKSSASFSSLLGLLISCAIVVKTIGNAYDDS